MTIRISVDETYPKFAALAPEVLKKVSVSIGPSNASSVFFSYDAYPLNFSTVGDAGVNQATLMVSYRRPLSFSDEAFGVFGNVNNSSYTAVRLASMLADYVKRGVLKVEQNGTPLTPEDILTFVP